MRPSSNSFFVELGDRGLGLGIWEDWINGIDCDPVEASRRIKARRIGIDAAMMETAGSAVPKILMFIVVAFCVVRFNLGY
jgi:hypothetical protein